jgi:acetyltransferase-like isoleucine patch superfamily enzyme
VRRFHSHGTGRFDPAELAAIGENAVFEEGVRIFRPDTIRLGDNVYVGHGTLLKGYPDGGIEIGDDCWIGPYCQLSGAARITIGSGVGIGPAVQILTSTHRDPGHGRPILDGELQRAPVRVGDGTDLGAGAIVLPGVRIGVGVQVGAGAVVSEDLPDYAVAAGVPAQVLRLRDS